MLLPVLKVLAILATAFLAWLLAAGAVLDVLHRRAGARHRGASREDVPAAKGGDGRPLY